MNIIGRISAAPSFSGLRRFPEGRGFKQWTGDDSKALMKVWYYLNNFLYSTMLQVADIITTIRSFYLLLQA